jgi:hypothetical protein
MRGELHTMMIDREWQKSRARASPGCSARSRYAEFGINMELLSNLISSFDPTKPNFRPTELYNESWLIKIVLHQASGIEYDGFPLGFLPGSSWFSEGLLPTVFKARYRGDKLAESRTNADGVVGHFLIGEKAKADFELIPEANQFTVVEAKVGSPLSSGTSNAPYYDQAARNVACMAEVLARSNINLAGLERLDFIVIAPQSSIEKGTFAEEIKPSSIQSKVMRRVSEYEGQLDEWFINNFEPTIEQIQLISLSWESAIEWICVNRPEVKEQLENFYKMCLEFN